MFLTAAILKSKRACVNQLALFSATFPEGVEVTPEVCVSVADKFDWNWAAANLLPPLLIADYDAKRAPLDADYDAKVASLFGELAVRAALSHTGKETK